MVKRPQNLLYIALVVIVAFSVALRSLMQIYFLYEKETLQQTIFPIQYAAKLEPNLDESRQEEIQKSIESLPDINLSEVNLPIPHWSGEPDYEADWNRMWKAYLSPILYATSEYQENPLQRAPQLADEIRSVSGVLAVVWDQNQFHSFYSGLDQWRKEQGYFSILFFLFMAGIVGGLVSNYPGRLKRHSVVRGGIGGAGSQINPERIWMFLVLLHAGITAIAFFILFTLGYLLFPFPTISPEGAGYLSHLLEGIVLSGGLAGAICLIGWWLRDEGSDAASSLTTMTGGS